MGKNELIALYGAIKNVRYKLNSAYKRGEDLKAFDELERETYLEARFLLRDLQIVLEVE